MTNLIKDYRSLNIWLSKRRGRLSELARQLEMKRQTLHSNIYCYRIDTNMMQRIKGYMHQIETQEKQAIKLHGRLSSWMYRGNGRQKLLASYLGISTLSMRKLAQAKGNARYNLLKYGLQNIRNGISHVEFEIQGGFRNHIQTITNLYRPLKNKYFTFDQLLEILENTRLYANWGHMSASLIFQESGKEQYRVLALGFDSKHAGMIESHICDLSNPHVHSSRMAKLNLAKGNAVAEIGKIALLADLLPCIECVPHLVNVGISEIYYHQDIHKFSALKMFEYQNISIKQINI